MSGRESRKEKEKGNTRERKRAWVKEKRESKKIRKASDAQIIGHATGKAWCVFYDCCVY